MFFSSETGSVQISSYQLLLGLFCPYKNWRTKCFGFARGYVLDYFVAGSSNHLEFCVHNTSWSKLKTESLICAYEPLFINKSSSELTDHRFYFYSILEKVPTKSGSYLPDWYALDVYYHSSDVHVCIPIWRYILSLCACHTLALASSSAISRIDSRLRWASSSLLSSIAIFICSFFCSSSCCRLTLFRFLFSSLSRSFCSRLRSFSSFLLSFSSSSCSFCFLKKGQFNICEYLCNMIILSLLNALLVFFVLSRVQRVKELSLVKFMFELE